MRPPSTRLVAPIRVTMIWLGIAAAANVGRAVADSPPPAQPAGSLFRDGDRIVWLGATFVERLQLSGDLETRLTAEHPHLQLTFRNLGWSGDEASGISRAVFGAVEQGWERLQRDLKLAAPTLVLIQYGGVEAESGPSGVASFKSQIQRLLRETQALNARAVLVTPVHRVRSSKRLPDPTPYNRSLDLYSAALAELALEHAVPLIDLRSLLRAEWTDNGLLPNSQGAGPLAEELARRLNAGPRPWSVRIDVARNRYTAEDTSLSAPDWSDHHVRFHARDRFLPPLPNAAASAGRLQIQGLAAGRYQLQIDDEEVAIATAEQWSSEVTLPTRGGAAQTAALRDAILQKDLLFFHRHRPQNETYLFLFRKHEQGNNAVEVPQFDPLIDALEKRIAELRTPSAHRYEIRRLTP